MMRWVQAHSPLLDTLVRSQGIGDVVTDVVNAAGPTAGLQLAVRAIVVDVLARGVGASLSTNVDFKARYNIGAGTMQRALDLLGDRGAVTVVNRGHLGRRVEHIEVGQSWQAAALPPVRLILPPSGPIEIAVLADHLAKELTRLGVSYSMHQLRGGTGRLVALEAGEYDLAVVSAGTWSATNLRRGSVIPEIVRQLAASTYYAPGRLVVVTRQGQDRTTIKKVAIDRQSPDHAALTLSEFPPTQNFEYIDAPFPSVPAWVLRQKVDAGIWHEAVSVIPLDLAGIELTKLQNPAATEVSDALSSATLVGSKERPELRSIINALQLNDLQLAQHAALVAAHDDSLS